MMRRVFVTSIPKCGTHLLMGFLAALGFRRHVPDDAAYRAAWGNYTRLKGLFGDATDPKEMSELDAQVRAGRQKLVDDLAKASPACLVGHHYSYDPQLLQALVDLDYAIVFMVRDPRDQMISFRNHVLRDQASDQYSRFSRQSAEQTYLDLLYGAPADPKLGVPVTSIVDLYGSFQGWLESPVVHSLAFGHLIGPKGDGLRLRQLYEADRLLARTGYSPQTDPDEELRLMFNPKHSLFVAGRSGQWREEFSPELVHKFEVECGLKLATYMRFLDDECPAGWDDYCGAAHTLRRAFWLAERDLADALSELANLRRETQHLGGMVQRIESDSQHRLALIHRLNTELALLRAR